MAQFIAFDPHVEVNGATILAVTASLGEAALPILAAHGLANVQSNRWYLQQAWLDVFRDIAAPKSNGMFDLVAIGMAIPTNAAFPPDVDSIIPALRSIDAAYHMNHRGGEIGHYQASVVSTCQVDLECRNPYPCDFDYGFIYSMARRFCPKNTHVTVYHAAGAGCRKQGADACTYHVAWRAD